MNNQAQKTQKPKTVYRVEHNKQNPYVMTVRATAKDRRLSFEARGMLWYLLSQPDHWEVNPKDLQQNCGKGKVYRLLKELRDFKYITYEVKRDPKGKITEHSYIIRETPLPENQEVAKQEMANPLLENRDGLVSSDLLVSSDTTDKSDGKEKEHAPIGATPLPIPTKEIISNCEVKLYTPTQVHPVMRTELVDLLSTPLPEPPANVAVPQPTPVSAPPPPKIGAYVRTLVQLDAPFQDSEPRTNARFVPVGTVGKVTGHNPLMAEFPMGEYDLKPGEYEVTTKPATPKKPVALKSPKTFDDWLARMEATPNISALTHALFTAIAPNYAGLHNSPKSYATRGMLASYVPVAEELARIGVTCQNVADMAKVLIPLYKANGWAIAPSSFEKRYQDWKTGNLPLSSPKPSTNPVPQPTPPRPALSNGLKVGDVLPFINQPKESAS